MKMWPLTQRQSPFALGTTICHDVAAMLPQCGAVCDAWVCRQGLLLSTERVLWHAGQLQRHVRAGCAVDMDAASESCQVPPHTTCVFQAYSSSHVANCFIL